LRFAECLEKLKHPPASALQVRNLEGTPLLPLWPAAVLRSVCALAHKRQKLRPDPHSAATAAPSPPKRGRDRSKRIPPSPLCGMEQAGWTADHRRSRLRSPAQKGIWDKNRLA